MKKTKKKKKPTQEPGEGGHLDQSLTEIATSTGGVVQKNWKGIVAGVAAIFLVIAIVQAMAAMEKSREKSFHERSFQLRDSAQGNDGLPDLAGFSKLLADVSGAKAERSVLRASVTYLLSRADSFARRMEDDAEEKTSTSLTVDGTEDETEKAKMDPGQAYETIIATVQEHLQATRTRLASDPEMVSWADAVDKKINEQKDKSWLPEAQKFQLQAPGEAPTSGETSSGADEASADAAPDSSTPVDDGAPVDDGSPEKKTAAPETPVAEKK